MDGAAAAATGEDDLALARALMAQRAPEDIAAAYVRLARSTMPAPEDLAEDAPAPAPYAPERGRDRERSAGWDRERDRRGPGPEAPPEPPRPGFEDAVWFRIDLGRNKNAEARWLLPLICRRGHLTKRDIGAIRVFERETRFQIVADAVERFEAAAAKSDSDGGRIRRIDDADASPPPPRQARPPYPPKGAKPKFKKKGKPNG